MAEIEFVETSSEFIAFLTMISKDNSNLLIDDHYFTSEYERIHDVTSYVDKVHGSGQIFITNPSFTKERLIMSYTVNNNIGNFYSLAQGEGGAHLLLLFFKRDVDGYIFFRCALRYLKWYKSGDLGGEYYPPPIEMREYYKKLSRFVRREAKSIECPRGRKYWFGPQAHKLSEAHGILPETIIFGQPL